MSQWNNEPKNRFHAATASKSRRPSCPWPSLCQWPLGWARPWWGELRGTAGRPQYPGTSVSQPRAHSSFLAPPASVLEWRDTQAQPVCSHTQAGSQHWGAGWGWMCAVPVSSLQGRPRPWEQAALTLEVSQA